MLIRTPRGNEVGAVTDLLGEAFLHDPVIARFVARNASNRRRRIARLFLSDIRATGRDSVDAAFESSGTLLGAAIWRAPGHRTARWQTLADAPGLLATVGINGARALRAYGREVEKHAPQGDFWHLMDIGAAPAARGRGVGRTLLEHRLTIIDARREPAFLEASTLNSRRLYERHGFEPMALIEHGPAAGATMMLRPARP